MKYRKFGKCNEELSILGFGCMRLPENEGKIDENEAIKMIRYAVDNGVNYIDTAYIYHQGESEVLVGKALKDGYRNKVKLATKLPTWLIKSREDMDKYLDEQLSKLDTSYIDYYLIHALDKKSYNRVKELGLFEFIENIKTEGRVKYVGFSFHDTLDVFKYIVDDFEWDFTQIQYNYLDENYQAGTEGLEYAASKNLGVVIMEPLRGGSLVNNLSDDIKSIIEEAKEEKNAASWAFQFLYNREEVSVVLSGMSTMDQVIDNLQIAENYGIANSMTRYEVEVIDRLKSKFKSKIKVNCTGCEYCLPCPKGVSIPSCFELLNNSSMFNSVDKIKKTQYSSLIKENKHASICVECGLCESKCPQKILIREALKEVINTFEM